MDPVFQDLIEHPRENLLKLLVCKHEKLNSMKLTIMQNYDPKEMSLKIKNGDRWGKIQRNAQ
jgi:hypothetical protein